MSTSTGAASSRLDWRDRRSDRDAWARELGVSRDAIDVHLASEVIDLHVDSFIWTRVFGYDLRRRHGHGVLGARAYSMVDFPRVREAALSGAIWVITTNPLRGKGERPNVFVENVRRLQGIFESVPEDFAVVRNVAEYRRARAAGKHAAFIGIQGGNALDRDPAALDLIPDDLVVRITLVHLTNSGLGVTSAPTRSRRGEGLTERGRDYVRHMAAKRILLDLAHINREGFFDAIAAHDRTLPFLVTHTGVAGVHRHWRNLDDEQLRAVANSGGTVGVMYHAPFLGDPWAGGRAETIVKHIAHIVDTIGEDHASIGSDYDGAINPPRDMPTILELPRLADLMLRRGWSAERIGKILGGNFLRVVEAVRG